MLVPSHYWAASIAVVTVLLMIALLVESAA